jgi:hypothetical protein
MNKNISPLFFNKSTIVWNKLVLGEDVPSFLFDYKNHKIGTMESVHLSCPRISLPTASILSVQAKAHVPEKLYDRLVSLY